MPVAAGAGIGIADLLVFVFMLLIAVVLWTLLQARPAVGGIPVVGGSGVSLIDSLRAAIVQLATSLEGFLTAQQQAAGDLWTRFVTNILNPAIAAWQSMVISNGLAIEDLVKRAVPALQVGLTDTEAIVGNTVIPQLHQLEADAVAETDYVRNVLAVDLAAAAGRLAMAESELLNISGRVLAAESQLLNIEQAVGQLLPFVGILGGLAAFERTAAGGVVALEGELGQLRGRLAGSELTVQKLAALLGLVALGAVAIENLIRVARNPCTACGQNDLSDYEARLFSLEMFGET